MANAIVRRVTGKQFIGIDSTNHSVVISTPAEGIGVKPSDLLLVSLASCTGVDVVEILEKKKINLISLEISVTAEQDQDPPWTYRKIHLLYKVKGDGLTEKALQQAIHISETKYCAVAATIRGVVEITTSYEIL
jgi:putative redox protein